MKLKLYANLRDIVGKDEVEMELKAPILRPHVMIALRTAVSLSIIIIVVTEMLVGAQYGLGTRAQNVQKTNNIPDLFVTIMTIGFIGVVLNKTLVWMDRKLVYWKSN